MPNINPYSPNFNPNAPLTYASGSFYSAPSYGYPNTGYSADQPYNSNQYVVGVNPYGLPITNTGQNAIGSSQTYQYPNLGSTYGSGLYGYGLPGFNNQYPNWMQGNSHQYYTGGTGNGLTNSGYYWYGKSANGPFDDRTVTYVEALPPVSPNFLAPAPIRPPNK